MSNDGRLKLGLAGMSTRIFIPFRVSGSHEIHFGVGLYRQRFGMLIFVTEASLLQSGVVMTLEKKEFVFWVHLDEVGRRLGADWGAGRWA
jgi:hypothetical protein